jgi:hypothetical protein
LYDQSRAKGLAGGKRISLGSEGLQILPAEGGVQLVQDRLQYRHGVFPQEVTSVNLQQQ